MTEIQTLKDRVTIEIRDDIAFVTLNRADKLNALDMPMFEAITAAARKLKKNKDIRAVILAGDGKAFCSGLDVKSMFKNPLAPLRLLVKPGTKVSNLAQDVSVLWREVPVPVIAVVHGKCWGGGFQIALGADFRYTTPDCEFSIMEARWGLIPDMGGTLAFRELSRIDVIKELTMTGRVFSADEAKDFGLITAIHEDPMAAAISLAEQIKERSPDAVVASKTLVNKTWLGTIRNALNWETKLQKKLIGRYNQRAAISQGKDPENSKPFKRRA